MLEPGPSPRFARFPTPAAGLAALRDQLCRYITRNGISSKWALLTKNDTTAYIQSGHSDNTMGR